MFGSSSPELSSLAARLHSHLLSQTHVLCICCLASPPLTPTPRVVRSKPSTADICEVDLCLIRPDEKLRVTVSTTIVTLMLLVTLLCMVLFGARVDKVH